jgi:hypothetical protein
LGLFAVKLRFVNARSSASASSSMPTLRAVSTKRSNCFGSSGLRLRGFGCVARLDEDLGMTRIIARPSSKGRPNLETITRKPLVPSWGRRRPTEVSRDECAPNKKDVVADRYLSTHRYQIASQMKRRPITHSGYRETVRCYRAIWDDFSSYLWMGGRKRGNPRIATSRTPFQIIECAGGGDAIKGKQLAVILNYERYSQRGEFAGNGWRYNCWNRSTPNQDKRDYTCDEAYRFYQKSFGPKL